VAFFQQREVIPPDMKCSNGHDMKLSFSKSPRWRCYVKSCRQEKCVRVDNWLSGSKLKLETIVHFIYCWTRELTSVKFCMEELEMANHAVVDYNNYLREVCAWKMSVISNSEIGGVGLHVEIDESLFSRRKSSAGRVLPQQWIFGGICRETKECFIVMVPDRSAETLLPIICEKIRAGSTIYSDSWRSYTRLQEEGYDHHVVNHRYNFVDPVTGAHTQNVERLWGSAKWGNKRRRGTQRDFLSSYLSEFMWRTKLNGRDPFDAILNDIVEFNVHVQNK